MQDDIRDLKEQLRSLEEKLRLLEDKLSETPQHGQEPQPPRKSQASAEAQPEGGPQEGVRTGHSTVRKAKPSMIIRKTDDGKIIVDVGSMGEILEEVVTGIKGEIERSVMIGTEKVKQSAQKIAARRDVDETYASNVFGAVGNEHRLRILEELETGGMYASELEAKIGVSPSTLSAHLKVLVESGLLTQEGTRGRYLLTLLGRRTLRWARYLSKG